MKKKAKYILPVKKSAVTGIVKKNRAHVGPLKHAIDFIVPEGTPIYAARAGLVVFVKDSSKIGGTSKKFAAHGNMIQIWHKDGTFADYLHLKYKGAKVKPGQRVRQGQVIGYSGNTGWSAGPHLHFMVWMPQGINVSKYLFLKKRKRTK